MKNRVMKIAVAAAIALTLSGCEQFIEDLEESDGSAITAEQQAQLDEFREERRDRRRSSGGSSGGGGGGGGWTG